VNSEPYAHRGWLFAVTPHRLTACSYGSLFTY